MGKDGKPGLLTALSDATAGLNLASGDVEMFIKGLSRMRTTKEPRLFFQRVDKCLQSWYNTGIYVFTYSSCAHGAVPLNGGFSNV